ncbi:MAG: GTP-binding protein [archaeon]|nr:GTP-binding protein [archaeon]
MSKKPRPPILKIFIAGEGGVGKTTMVERLIRGKFINTKITVGVQHVIKNMITPKSGKEVILQIWDLGGEERFRFLVPLYVQGSSAGIFAFDETRYPTYMMLSEWVESAKKTIKPDTPLILISTKADLGEESEILKERISVLMKEHDFRAYFRTSSKTGLNINKVFEKTVEILEEENKIWKDQLY